MRLGIIDLGTNSVRFDVHLIGTQGSTRLLHREKLMIRLGQGVFLENKLDSSAIRRTLHAFQSFRRTATILQTQKVIAFGTSALREASDSDRLIHLIKKKTGIDIRIISGNEEAYLIAVGILTNESKLKGKFGLIDIGGGSTEISICSGTKILRSSSFPLGTARLQQIFLKSSPPKASAGIHSDPLMNLRKFIQGVLQAEMETEKWPKVLQVIGSSGTIRALDKILRKTTGSSCIYRKDLKKLVQSMSTMNKTQLQDIPGMEPKRVDMILSGAVLLEECIKSIGANEVIATSYSLRDGILDREIRLHSHQMATDTGFQLDELFRKAHRFCATKPLENRVELAKELFKRTKQVHQLKPKWCHFLCSAVILKDLGKAISPIHYEAHSYYIVRNADFLGMEKWESEFIAQLCLKHNTRKLSKKDLSFLKEKTRRQAFSRILALLSVVDAIDQENQTQIKIKRIQTLKKQVHLIVTGKGLTDLEVLRVDQKKALFEKVFRRSLKVTRA